MEHTQRQRRSSRTFLIGLVAGSTLGAAAMGTVLWLQGAKSFSINAAIGGALMMGLLSAGVTSACSWEGENSPGKTAVWTILGGLGIWAFVEAKAWLTGQPIGISGKFALSVLALWVTLAACSSLGTWLSRRYEKHNDSYEAV